MNAQSEGGAVGPQAFEAKGGVGQDLSATETRIYQAYLDRSGKDAADHWLRTYLATKPGGTSKTVKPVNRQHSSHASHPSGWVNDARAKEDFRKRALAELLGRVKDRDVFGQKAICLAEEIIGPVWQQALGCAYPLVLLLVKGALEDARRPGEPGGNDYHVLSNLPSLGVLSAAVVERETSYTEKTIRRWLAVDAPHAKALRCWLGWRHWYTDTLLEYRKGIDPKTGEAYRTGKSRGPVIGGTLFRVRLTPLPHISDARLKECNEARPSVLQPLKPELERDWRDLERGPPRG